MYYSDSIKISLIIKIINVYSKIIKKNKLKNLKKWVGLQIIIIMMKIQTKKF